MTANLHVIDGAEPVDDIVVCLEKLLEDAKDGTVRELAVVAVHSDGCVATAYPRDGLRMDAFRTLGGLAYLTHRVNSEVIEPGEG